MNWLQGNVPGESTQMVRIKDRNKSNVSASKTNVEVLEARKLSMVRSLSNLRMLRNHYKPRGSLLLT